MSTRILPIIIDIQPEPADKIIRLPNWFKYLFLICYLAAVVGTILFGREAYYFSHLYADKVQAKHLADKTKNEIAQLQRVLETNKKVQSDYDFFKLKQKAVSRPGIIFNWVPLLVKKDQNAQTITLQVVGQDLNLRVALQTPFNEPVVTGFKGPEGYTVFSSGEDAAHYNEMPSNTKPAQNMQYTVVTAQLRKNNDN